MKSLILESPAKINLNLQILNKREDGYHNLKSEFRTINLFDKITLTKIPEGIQLTTSGNYKIPNNRDNLVYQVAEKLRSHAKGKVGVKIEIDKQIPLFAGLGGGSSNAATVLKGLNELWNLDLSLEKQIEIGAKIGADVPFFLYACPPGRRGKCLVEGIGEKVTPLQTEEKPGFVIIAQLPHIKIATPWAYAQFDKFEAPLEGGRGVLFSQGEQQQSPNKFKIRKANKSEKEIVKKIREEKLLRPKGFINESDWGYKKDEEVLVALDKEQIVGHIGFLKEKNEIHIRTLYIDEKHQKKGIGKQLIAEIRKLALDNNLEKISVYAENQAVVFYQKNGFFKTGETKTANGTSYPCMELKVPLENDFEKVIFPHFPDLENLKESFLENGAVKANLTGSGSAVYGIFEEREIAEKCMEKIREKCEFCWLGGFI